MLVQLFGRRNAYGLHLLIEDKRVFQFQDGHVVVISASVVLRVHVQFAHRMDAQLFHVNRPDPYLEVVRLAVEVETVRGSEYVVAADDRRAAFELGFVVK